MKLPFNLSVDGYEAATVEHPGTKQKCLLQPEALAVYNWIIGAELLLRSKDAAMFLHGGIADAHSEAPLPTVANMQKAKNWFRKYFPDEYQILLD